MRSHGLGSVLVMLLLASGVACDVRESVFGGGEVYVPPATGHAHVRVDLKAGYGWLLIDDNECAQFNHDTIRAQSERAMDETREALGTYAPMEGLVVTGVREIIVQGLSRNGAFYPGQNHVVLRCGYSGTMRHEMFHVQAYKLGLSCYRDVGHTMTIDECVGSAWFTRPRALEVIH